MASSRPNIHENKNKKKITPHNENGKEKGSKKKKLDKDISKENTWTFVLICRIHDYTNTICPWNSKRHKTIKHSATSNISALTINSFATPNLNKKEVKESLFSSRSVIFSFGVSFKDCCFFTGVQFEIGNGWLMKSVDLETIETNSKREKAEKSQQRYAFVEGEKRNFSRCHCLFQKALWNLIVGKYFVFYSFGFKATNIGEGGEWAK